MRQRNGRRLARIEPLEARMLLSLSGGFQWNGWGPPDATDARTAVLQYDFVGTPAVSIAGAEATVVIPGEQTWQSPGDPILPVHPSTLILPQGCQIASVEIDPGPATVLGRGVALLAAPAALPDAYPGGAAVLPPDHQLASSFPQQLVNYLSQTRCGYSLGVLGIFPVQYDAPTGTLLYHPAMTVTVTVRPGAATASIRNDPQDIAAVAAMVDNPEAMADYSRADASSLMALPPGGPFDYVIVTSDALKDAFQPLVNEKSARGLTATIVTTDYIYANYTGTETQDNADKIRQFVADAYAGWGTHWLLLGGDVDVVPTRGVYVEAFDDDGIYVDENLPSDFYFVCLDGPWNGDGDSRWSETNDGTAGGDVDLAAELYVGRAPASNATEAGNFVGKTIQYETSIHPNRTSAVWLGEQLDSETWGSSSKAPIRETCLPADWSVTERYDSPGGSWSGSQFLADLNASPHLINHLGHSNASYNARVGSSNVDALTNTFPYFMYSQGCDAGAFDYTDCIAEHHVNGSHGAFAVIMNTRYGFYSPGDTPGDSHFWDLEFWDAVFNEHLTHLGQANEDSRSDNMFRLAVPGDYRWIQFELELFGDPETPLQVGNDVLGGNLDADGNGTADALSDGILILRYLFDPPGQWNVADALGAGATRTTRDPIKAYLDNCRTTTLDADGNGTADALSDGILILRYLFDPPGQWNVNDALGAGAIRTTREEIKDYLDGFNPVLPPVPKSAATVPIEDPWAQSQSVPADSSSFTVDTTEPVNANVEAVAGADAGQVQAVISQAVVVADTGTVAFTPVDEKLAPDEESQPIDLRAVDAALESWAAPTAYDVNLGWTPDQGKGNDEEVGQVWGDGDLDWLPTPSECLGGLAGYRS